MESWNQTRKSADDVARPAPSPCALWTRGDLIAGRYGVCELLGRGGMAEVYRACDLRAGVDVALKVPRDRTEPGLAALRAELEALSRVRHPHVARLDAVTWFGDTPVAVLELLSPRSLAARLHRHGAYLPAQGWALVDAVASGLEALHDAGVAHNDLKSDNVLFRGHTPVLADLGLASFAHTDPSELSHPVGTPSAMAPEMILGRARTLALRHKADQYALAALAYECLTGSLLFEGSNPWSVWNAHLHHAPEAPSSRNPALTPYVDTVLLRALAKKPDERFDDVRDFRRALRDAVWG